MAESTGALDARSLTIFYRADYVASQQSFDTVRKAGLLAESLVDDAILTERERLVFDWAAGIGVPIMFVLAGGYSAGDMGTEHLTALRRLTVQAAARSVRS